MNDQILGSLRFSLLWSKVKNAENSPSHPHPGMSISLYSMVIEETTQMVIITNGAHKISSSFSNRNIYAGKYLYSFKYVYVLIRFVISISFDNRTK